jgi:hypothetical protein
MFCGPLGNIETQVDRSLSYFESMVGEIELTGVVPCKLNRLLGDIRSNILAIT